MRVITGLYKGRTIATVSDLSVRPATGRVRQTVFNMLAHRIDLEGTRLLDLYAGSGSLGIEGLSRGASHVTFVEQNPDAADCIARNLRTLGCEDAAELLEMDVFAYLGLPHEPCTVVFADPPYGDENTAQIPDRVFAAGLVRPGGYLLIEHAQNIHFQGTALYSAGPEKKFGRTMITFFQPINARSAEP